MKLCFIADAASIHTQRWVRWFADDHEVSLIATTADERLADLTALTLPESATLRLGASVLAVRRALRALQPDVVHAHFINEAGWFAAAGGRRPFVLSAWGSDIYRAPTESRLAGRLNPWAARRADAVTCDSDDQALALRAWGVERERIEVVNWGVDRREFHPGIDGKVLRERLGIPADVPVVLSPRQWLANSNIDAIIRAHARMQTDAFLVLKRLPRFERDAGNDIRAAVEQSERRDRIRIVEEVAPSDLPGVYAAADIVVSLCTTDGTPVSLLEAMSMGRLVLALRNPSVAEWVAEPGGRLVDSLATDALARELDALVQRRGDPAGAAHNVAVVVQRADRAAEMGRAAALYERLTANRGVR